MTHLKRVFYHLCKWIGCFSIASRLTAYGVRILCYHGLVLHDEDRFRPRMFMDVALFRQRMQYLVRKGYPVLSLAEAVERLGRRELPKCATVVTFDDGFYSTWRLAVPVLQEFKVPATIYVTTYYCVRSNPIFRLVIQYMFWKTKKTHVDLTEFGGLETANADLASEEAREAVIWRIIGYGEKELTEDQRVQFCDKLGARLEVPYAAIAAQRFLSLMTTEEISAVVEGGVDIQLHPHRHCLPPEATLVRREITDNRKVLEPLTNRRLRHFCYPSGIHCPDHLQPLTEADILSATTCDAGLNFSSTPPLVLHRFLDGNNISQIEFEAEMSGFTECLRAVRSRTKQLIQRVIGLFSGREQRFA